MQFTVCENCRLFNAFRHSRWHHTRTNSLFRRCKNLYNTPEQCSLGQGLLDNSLYTGLQILAQITAIRYYAITLSRLHACLYNAVPGVTAKATAARHSLYCTPSVKWEQADCGINLQITSGICHLDQA